LLVQHVSATDNHHQGDHAESTASFLLTVYVILRGTWNPEEKGDTFLRNVGKHPATKRQIPEKGNPRLHCIKTPQLVSSKLFNKISNSTWTSSTKV